MDTTSDDIKTAARQLIDSLPVGASWEDVMYGVWVRQCIDAGIAVAECGDVVSVEDVRESSVFRDESCLD